MSILSITLAYIIGIKWGLYQDVKVLVGLSIFLLIFMLLYKRKNTNKMTAVVIICVFGSVYAKCKFNYMNEKYCNTEVETELIILTHESISSNGYSYKYHVKNLIGDKFVLYVKVKKENLFDIGSKIKIKGKFIKPEPSRNKGGFDNQKYFYSNNMYGTIIASDVKVINLETRNLIYKIQNKIRKNMLKIFDKETAGILIGMLIGETTDISKVIQENFKTSRSYAFACCFGCKCNADYFTLKYDIF
ncbi:MAG: DUF4131 domain-containing protein [Clostridia bacterium]|nr:DUF4131 domain-containing protein [Clostridia bacterium]